MYAICKVLPALCRKDFAPKLFPNAGTATKRISGSVLLSRKLQQPETKKILLVMKLTAIILLVCCLQVSAKLNSQTVNLSVKAVTLEKIFTAIERQTGYTVVVNARLIRSLPPVSIEAKNEPLQEFLTKLLTSRSLDFAIESKTIVISSAKKTEVLTEPVKVALQYMEIHGRVVDSTGAPLSGASVTVKGKSKGTTTNARGEFAIEAQPGDVLIITFIGYEIKQITVGDGNPVVVLKVSDSPLDEIQVRAYDVTSRRFNTGNIGTVKAADIEKQPVNNPLLALEGRIPGLQINQQNGIAGGAVTVVIQGYNSLLKGNDPLYVIDGVPYSSETFYTNGVLGMQNDGMGMNARGPIGNPLAYINSQDIESIDILKDADATSIYGSRAANGAILITTKKGKSGSTSVSLNLQSGVGKVTRKLDLLNTQQYLEMRKEAYDNSGVTTYPVSAYDVNGTWDQSAYTDWQKVLIGNTVHYNDFQGTISGGTKSATFLIGGNYHQESSPFVGDFGDKKASVHFNFSSTSLNDRFKLSFTGNYLADKNYLPQIDLTANAMVFAPNYPSLRNADGTINWAPNASGISTIPNNPLIYTLNNYTANTDNLISSMNLSYQILKGLSISSNLGYNNIRVDQKSYNPSGAIPPENRPTSFPSSSFINSLSNSWIIEPQLKYQIQIGLGVLNALLGGTFQSQNTKTLGVVAYGFNNDTELDNPSSALYQYISPSSTSAYRYNAFFSQLNYNLRNRYILNLSTRRDGSSRFGAENRFHNFGSIGAAWIFSEEQLLKGNLTFLSFGKINASYGTTGNDQIGNYAYLSNYRYINSNINYQNINGLTADGIANPYIQWELTKKLNFGLELGFLKDRLLFSGNVYRNRSSNQLIDYSLPTTAGFQSVLQNLPALVQNTGFEFSLNSINIQKKTFKWTSSFNISKNSNKLLAYPGLESSSFANNLIIGQPTSINILYKFYDVDPATGQYRFVLKDGTISSTPGDGSENKIVAFDTRPSLLGGLQNNITYKSVELSFFFQSVKQKGLSVLYSTNGGVPPGYTRQNQINSVLERWQQPGDIASIQKYVVNNTTGYLTTSRYVSQSDAAYTDASYIRLKNVSLSWQLPESFRSKLGIKSAKLFIQGQNLLTLTSYKGLDPETRGSLTLPPLRILTTGVQAIF